VRRVSTPSDRIAAIGAGTSALVSSLLADDYRSITAVDISGAAIDRLRQQLGETDRVSYVQEDARHVRLSPPVAVWHDRATFHFLTADADRLAYAHAAAASIRPNGHLIVATFAETGPERCSGLPVARHSPDSLVSVFGFGFDLVRSFERDHTTPAGSTQRFLHAVLRAHGRG
jgi:2-polyprenyl-3-methyl-5-hydroxy-6-metoxy-1,4-benzoquinol methylase